MKIKLGVIFGGESVEHEVSIISAIQAMNKMDNEKYEIIPIYIAKNREWYTGESLKDIDTFQDMDLLKIYCKNVVLYTKDGHFVLQNKKGIFKSVVLGKTISDIIKILSDSEEEVTVSRYNNTVVFDLGHTKIRTSTVEGEFYKYENNLPKTVRTEITVKKDELEECLVRAGIISRENYYNTVMINIEQNVMNIVAESEKGKIDEYIDCNVSGEDLKICLNNKYLQEAVARIKEDFVRIKFDGGTRPIMVEKMEGDEFRCIILPVRVV